jgi:choline dehydrogenase-like flavoprotein
MIDSCDYVVVGSGAAGATAALVLAEAGKDVVVIEEGPRVRPEDRGLGPTEAFFRLFRDRGTQVAMGKSIIPILQGRCVGGTTVVNGAIVWRMPEDVHARVLKGKVSLQELERCFDRIEKDLSVTPTPDDLLGGNGTLMRKAAEKMGFKGHAIQRNVIGCKGSSRCLEACPTQRKQSMEQTYLPRAERLGARIHADKEVRLVEVRGGRATGVRGPGFQVEARQGVVLAASAIQTPCILQRSGLGGPHVGRHFTAHPGTAVMGIYKDPVRIWIGGTQTYEVDHFRHERFKMETVSLPLELAGVRMPGFGEAFQRGMKDFGNAAVWGVQVRAEAEGTVRHGSRTKIEYTPTAADMAIFKRGVKVLAEMHFAAGAVRVYPGVHGGPDVLTSPDDLKKLDDLPTDPRDYSLIAAHLFGTARMGEVLDDQLAVRDVDRLWVVDASIFPSNLGVNPQHAIMAMAMLAAERIAS